MVKNEHKIVQFLPVIILVGAILLMVVFSYTAWGVIIKFKTV